LDVVAWDCDFLACSAYKVFGPHAGMIWGRRKLLSELTPYKLRPAKDSLPDRWMTGTQNHEGIAGTRAMIEYLADLGRSVAPDVSTRRDALAAAFEAIGSYERNLLTYLMDQLAKLPSVTIWGITDPARFDQRLPTVSFTHAKMSPARLAEHLGDRNIFVWRGNYYALLLTETLGLEPDGTVRVGLLHYNTRQEVDRLIEALAELE
jgi:selenocysteine lyase/cysteine desulfurase